MSLPATMRCIEVPTPGGPEALVIGERPLPAPGPGEVLIRVAAAGINRADTLQRQGKYPPPPGASDLLGLEVAGEVAALGEGVSGLRAGDAVCALLPGGGYAEYAVAAAPLCLPCPAGYDGPRAAALPETLFTVWDNVFLRGRLRAGESLLVHGGTSGIGTTAIPLAKAFGARVFATARGPRKCEACVTLGCDLAIDYASEDFVAAIAQATEGRGVNVVLDMVGGDYLARNLDCLAMEGRHVSISVQRGARAEINIAKVMARRLVITGSTLRPRSVAEKAVIAEDLRAKVWPLLESGRLAPVIHTVLPFARAAEAHRIMEASEHIGKILLIP